MENWTDPTELKGAQAPKLHVLNTITKNKVLFTPREGNHVSWYACGPTVYDASHIGHARNYMCFDIVKRIFEDYFGYDVKLVMNVTDIDDKIIKRSNEQNVEFQEITKKFEKEFWEDMQALNIRMPDVITRVTEYIPQIISFVEKIQDKGFAYETKGSVYFDTQAYITKKDGDVQHVYGKLQPNNVGNTALVAEGEGSLSLDLGDKKHPSDFALWKASKPGEPKWLAPRWGEGRPGWHIECSAMATEILGTNLDIHSGGCDLKFPHHENEIAQSEAFSGNNQWVNYFLHAGHLHIEGLKMSKSLKNFITIRNCLQRWSARQIRLLFLSRKYNEPMDYAEEAMAQITELEQQFSNFFDNTEVFIRDEAVNTTHSEAWTDVDREFSTAFEARRATVHMALCDDFDTPRALSALQDIVKLTNVYMQRDSSRGRLVQQAALYVSKMFRIFGLNASSDVIGWKTAAAGADALTPILNALCDFRAKIRTAGLEKDAPELLTLCDQLRDDVLPVLGVRLEDRPGQAAAWKLDNPETIMKEIEQKKELQKQKELKKLEAKRKQEEQLKEKKLKAMIRPEEMFLSRTSEFSKFDQKGIPTHDAKGEPLTKGASKKLMKEYKKQQDLHEWLLNLEKSE